MKEKIKEIDIEFMTDTSAAMMQGVPIAYHFILWAAAIFLVVAAIWANFAVLDEVTVGQGKVIPSTNMQVVQNLEGGIVKDIRVKIGQIVERDEILMIIDDTRFSSSLKEGATQIYALEAKIHRLEAEISEREISFSERLQTEYPEYVQNETSLFDSRKKELGVKVNLLKEEEDRKNQELLEMQGKREQLQRSLDLVKKELALTRPLAKDGAVSEVEVLRLERTVNDLAGELEQTQLSIPRLESALSSAKKKIDELYISFKTESISELNKTRAEYKRLLETQKAAQDRFSRTVVRSPVKGTVNRVHVKTIGGVIQPGEDLFDIVPLNDTLLIEANIRPSDIGFLRSGLPATVKISAYDFSIYGGLKATVENISADTITDEKGDPYYQIRVRTTEKNYLVGKRGERLEIQTGMGATVDILTGQKTVLEYLLKPIIKAKRNAMREK
ncbi:HlyD family type I secretion periplasmic adaptor subunit [Candidatus Berkiella cookevillensis]|uniref:Membrane fusion protein (MFP) family protein n=2 Tax=Candidatus Berkiella cookevillensis TaxID=437022 RepID=A0A0Q9YAC3_9GAMM|nr:HlyD family type I secretion periplasmic adaptor subunit [Candidatus Berkiella cookevillensis]